MMHEHLDLWHLIEEEGRKSTVPNAKKEERDRLKGRNHKQPSSYSALDLNGKIAHVSIILDSGSCCEYHATILLST